MLTWLRERKRRRLREQPFPPVWEAHLTANVPYFALLSGEEQARLRGDIQVFIAEKYWEGCNGLVLTDEMRVTVAAYACLLQLNLPERGYYPNVRSILLYPAYYYAKRQKRNPAGVVVEKSEARSGEAWVDGPVILSWDDVQRGA